MGFANQMFGGGGGGVKAVQRGVIDLTGATSASATITLVNVAKVILRTTGVVSSGTSATDFSVRIELTNANTITATRQTPSAAASIGWELIEFN